MASRCKYEDKMYYCNKGLYCNEDNDYCDGHKIAQASTKWDRDSYEACLTRNTPLTAGKRKKLNF